MVTRAMRPFIFVLAALAGTIVITSSNSHPDGILQTNSCLPKVHIITYASGGKAEVLSNPIMESIDAYGRLMLESKEKYPEEYSERIKMLSDRIAATYRENMKALLIAHGVVATGIMLGINARGQLEAISIPFKHWEGCSDKPTEEQVLALFDELRSGIVFPEWDGEPQYVWMTVGRLSGKTEEDPPCTECSKNVSGVEDGRNNMCSPKVSIKAFPGKQTRFYIVEALSDPGMESMASLSRLAIIARSEHREAYSKQAKAIVEDFVHGQKDSLMAVLRSHGVIAPGVTVVINAQGQLEGISFSFRHWEGCLDRPTEEQALALFEDMRSRIRFKEWEGEPRYVFLGISGTAGPGLLNEHEL